MICVSPGDPGGAAGPPMALSPMANEPMAEASTDVPVPPGCSVPEMSGRIATAD